MDSAYETYDLGCAAAIDEMVSLGGDISLKMSIFERKKKDSRMQTKKQHHRHRCWSSILIIHHPDFINGVIIVIVIIIHFLPFKKRSWFQHL